MNSFTVIAASKEVKLSERAASVTFTVTNSTDKAVRGTPKLNPVRSTAKEWLSLTGGLGTREFSAKETKTLVVQIKVPGTAPLGEYTFGLNISNEANPDDDCTVGPAVAFKVEGTPLPNGEKKPFPWWILIVVGVLLVGGGLAIWLIIPSKVPVPNVVRKTLEEASNALVKVELGVEVAMLQATGTNQLGTVIGQEPKADEKVPKNTVVKVTVEKERDRVSVPQIVGLPPNRVKDLFGSLPLTFTERGRTVTGTQSPGLIAKQSRPAGEMVAPGTVVEYTVEEKRPTPPDNPNVVLPAPTLKAPANGTVFSHFPRRTTVDWNPVSQAASYTVEVEFSSGTWSRWKLEAGLKNTIYSFDFVGAQPGRWRVWAVDARGRPGTKSSWWEFRYTR